MSTLLFRRTFQAASGAAVLMLLAGAAQLPPPPQGEGDPGQASITLYGSFRDFRAHNVNNGHPDFETTPIAGRAIYYGVASDALNAEGDPVFASTGYKVTTQARNAAGRPICPPKSYIQTQSGDVAPSVSSNQGGAVTTAPNFSQWYRDVANVNISFQFPLTMLHNAQTGRYEFDGDLATQFAHVPGFGGNKVYGYTYELETTFVYRAGEGDIVTVGADDGLLVYVDGKLVADLGGNHAMAEQDIEMDRLTWLEDGETYTMKFFYAERKKTDSWLKISTTYQLGYVPPPETTALYD